MQAQPRGLIRIDAAIFPDLDSVDVDAAFELAEAAVERAFHLTDVAEYLDYYEL